MKKYRSLIPIALFFATAGLLSVEMQVLKTPSGIQLDKPWKVALFEFSQFLKSVESQSLDSKAL